MYSGLERRIDVIDLICREWWLNFEGWCFVFFFRPASADGYHHYHHQQTNRQALSPTPLMMATTDYPTNFSSIITACNKPSSLPAPAAGKPGIQHTAKVWCRISSFTQPPMRRMRICFTDVFFVFLFFCFFFAFCFYRSPQKYQTAVLGNGWTDFHETFTKR